MSQRVFKLQRLVTAQLLVVLLRFGALSLAILVVVIRIVAVVAGLAVVIVVVVIIPLIVIVPIVVLVVDRHLDEQCMSGGLRKRMVHLVVLVRLIFLATFRIHSTLLEHRKVVVIDVRRSGFHLGQLNRNQPLLIALGHKVGVVVVVLGKVAVAAKVFGIRQRILSFVVAAALVVAVAVVVVLLLLHCKVLLLEVMMVLLLLLHLHLEHRMHVHVRVHRRSHVRGKIHSIERWQHWMVLLDLLDESLVELHVLGEVGMIGMVGRGMHHLHRHPLVVEWRRNHVGRRTHTEVRMHL